METAVRKLSDTAASQPGVLGVVCSDQQGLCFCVSGAAKRDAAGWTAAMCQQVQKLHPESNETPVVCIETDNCNMLIKTKDNVTVGIYKSTS